VAPISPFGPLPIFYVFFGKNPLVMCLGRPKRDFCLFFFH
jgi:hypothetical protein